MRWAIVDSGTRNARAISWVVSPPSNLSVSATRASVFSSGWQAVKMRRSRSSPMSSWRAASRASTKSGTVWDPRASWSAAMSPCRASAIRRCRRWSSARCLAVVISQAPGLPGTPSVGQCSNAATKASCARSSAVPRSRTRCAIAAMTRADSMRQTAAMVSWTAECTVLSLPPSGAGVSSPSPTHMVSGNASKNSFDRARSRTGRLTNIWRIMVWHPRPSGRRRAA